MSTQQPPFAFSQFVPGFDFLKNLAAAGTAGAAPGMPSLSSWVAPTLSVEEIDKRINELKTVQFWLEQNTHAIKATLQALEVQKMTLSTLRGMNVRMEDLAQAFTRGAASAASAAGPAAEPPAAAPQAQPRDEAGHAGGGQSGNGIVNPLQWWGALTQQFQQIASQAMEDAAHLKMPEGVSDAMGQAMDTAFGAARAAADAAAPSAPASPRPRAPRAKAARKAPAAPAAKKKTRPRNAAPR